MPLIPCAVNGGWLWVAQRTTAAGVAIRAAPTTQELITMSQFPADARLAGNLVSETTGQPSG